MQPSLGTCPPQATKNRTKALRKHRDRMIPGAARVTSMASRIGVQNRRPQSAKCRTADQVMSGPVHQAGNPTLVTFIPTAWAILR